MTTNKRVSPGRAMYQAAEALQRKSEAQAERIAELEQQNAALRDALIDAKVALMTNQLGSTPNRPANERRRAKAAAEVRAIESAALAATEVR